MNLALSSQAFEAYIVALANLSATKNMSAMLCRGLSLPECP